MILYEYPFNERIRTYLRLEHLFRRLGELVPRTHPIDHHYALVKGLGKASLFPEKYLSQRNFAEAELFTYASDEYTPSSIEYIGERLAEFNGGQKRFFLFRITFEEEEGEKPETYLGIAGPYEIDPKNLETTNDATGYHYDEAYNKKQVDKHFRTLLDNAEEYIKKWKNK